eukprot:10469267-Alexandrium_andersonii.AAC.1
MCQDRVARLQAAHCESSCRHPLARPAGSVFDQLQLGYARRRPPSEGSDGVALTRLLCPLAGVEHRGV